MLMSFLGPIVQDMIRKGMSSDGSESDGATGQAGQTGGGARKRSGGGGGTGAQGQMGADGMEGMTPPGGKAGTTGRTGGAGRTGGRAKAGGTPQTMGMGNQDAGMLDPAESMNQLCEGGACPVPQAQGQGQGNILGAMDEQVTGPGQAPEVPEAPVPVPEEPAPTVPVPEEPAPQEAPETPVTYPSGTLEAGAAKQVWPPEPEQAQKQAPEPAQPQAQEPTANIGKYGTTGGLRDVLEGGGVRMTSGLGDGRNHGGVDIAAYRGTNVMAPNWGLNEPMRVSRVSTDPRTGYGNVIYLEGKLPSGEPITVLYGHLDNNSITVKPGQTVTPGQILGKVGNTGRTGNSKRGIGNWYEGKDYGYHLHFETRVNGNKVDPHSIFKRYPGRPLEGTQQAVPSQLKGMDAQVKGSGGVGPMMNDVAELGPDNMAAWSYKDHKTKGGSSWHSGFYNVQGGNAWQRGFYNAEKDHGELAAFNTAMRVAEAYPDTANANMDKSPSDATPRPPELASLDKAVTGSAPPPMDGNQEGWTLRPDYPVAAPSLEEMARYGIYMTPEGYASMTPDEINAMLEKEVINTRPHSDDMQMVIAPQPQAAQQQKAPPRAAQPGEKIVTNKQLMDIAKKQYGSPSNYPAVRMQYEKAGYTVVD